MRPALTPLIGRDEELELLLRRWQQAKSRRGPGGAALRRAGHRQVAPRRRRCSSACAASRTLRLRYFCSPHHTAQRAPPDHRPAGAGGGLRAGTTAPRAKLDKLEALLGRRCGTYAEDWR